MPEQYFPDCYFNRRHSMFWAFAKFGSRTAWVINVAILADSSRAV